MNTEQFNALIKVIEQIVRYEIARDAIGRGSRAALVADAKNAAIEHAKEILTKDVPIPYSPYQDGKFVP